MLSAMDHRAMRHIAGGSVLATSPLSNDTRSIEGGWYMSINFKLLSSNFSLISRRRWTLRP